MHLFILSRRQDKAQISNNTPMYPNPYRFLSMFLAAPTVGKDTQADLFGQAYKGLLTYGMSSMLRARSAVDGRFARMFRERSSSGELLGDFSTMTTLDRYFNPAEWESCILQGAPRSPIQVFLAGLIFSHFKFSRITLIHLKMSRANCRRRFKKTLNHPTRQSRNDNKAFEKRLDEYYSQEGPILETARSIGWRVVSIPVIVDQDPMKLFERVRRALGLQKPTPRGYANMLKYLDAKGIPTAFTL